MGVKFGRIVYGINSQSPAGFCNLGDWFQTFAVDHLYEEMGIPEEDIVNISRHELSSYSGGGEPVVLPMQGWFGHLVKGSELFPISPNIRPVFVGFHCLSKNVIDLTELKKYQPIGCRDEATWAFLTKCGVDAYISGCLTVTFPRRTPAEEGNEVLLIDADKRVLPFMPERLLDDAVKLTQEFVVNEQDGNVAERCEKRAREQLDRIHRAQLVVTSRLHCAGPSIAKGVPVVLAKPYFDQRYSWIDRYIKLYTRGEYGKIDWNVEPVDCEEIKTIVLENAKASLLNLPQSNELHRKVHALYMNRERSKIHVPWYRQAFSVLHEKFPQTAEIARNILVKKNPYW